MTAYVGIDGKARKVGAAYIGVDGVARKVVKAYVGVDGKAQLWWVLDEGGGPIVLEVGKITADTVAGEVTYTGEQFVLISIYPKTNGTVNVTYGGVTKTVSDTSGEETPNAQNVFFGTFNGVSDNVETPAIGELTIEGDCAAFGIGSYSAPGQYKATTEYCSCITAVAAWIDVENIPANAFYKCVSLDTPPLPSGVTSIGYSAFYGCSALTLKELPSGITSIGGSAFYDCKGIAITELPNGITSIDACTFQGCNSINISSIPNGVTTIGEAAFSIDPRQSPMYGGTITLPATVANIGSRAFSFQMFSTDEGGDYRQMYCPIFAKVIILATTPPTLGSLYPFGEHTYDMHVEIVVPAGCGDAYKVAGNWTNYADCIVEAS